MVMMTDGVTNNIFYRTGVRFNVTREQNLHIRHRIFLTFNVFPIILACMPQLRLEISSVKRMQVPMCIVSVP